MTSTIDNLYRYFNTLILYSWMLIDKNKYQEARKLL